MSRRSLSAIVLVLAALVAACAGEPTAPISSSPEAALREFEALDPATARDAYLDMAPATRANLWRAQFQRVLNSGLLTPAQAELFQELWDRADDLALSKNLATAYRARLQAIMGAEEIGLYASSLGGQREGFSVAAPEGLYGVTPPCNEDLACSTCRCAYGECQAFICTRCQVTDGGCGLFGWFDCDGMSTPSGPSCT